MTADEVDRFFSEYVTWMRHDIGREIDWFHAGHDAGNLLCALGLVVYTEALGRVRRWNFDRLNFRAENGDERPRRNFEEFFDRLAHGEYGRWRREWEAEHLDTTIYEVLRSGMVHEYRPKVPSFFHMGTEDRARGLDYEDGRLAVYVVPYYRDFCTAADRARDELLALSDPRLPDPHLRHGVNAIYTGPVVGGIPTPSPNEPPKSLPVVSPTSDAVASTADPHVFVGKWRTKKRDRG
jgi:hypothetical protein